MTTVSSAAQGKAKTKAKKRYLKRKKGRRKLRTKHTAQNAVDIAEGSESDTDLESQGEIVLRATPQAKQIRVTASPPPAKRRKTAEKVPGDEAPSVDELDTQVRGALPQQLEAKRASTPPPLPIFPLPTLPAAPSKSALALQGLDRALLSAEFVDPDIALSIPSDGSGDGGTRLGEKMRQRLHDIGIAELFAVQTSLLPFLIPPSNMQHRLYTPTQPTRDVCVSAPTGSGKTLAYVLPIIETLSSRIVTQLRALIVLPTRDLVAQVRETFEVLGKGRGLKVGIATGQHSFAHEQARLVNDHTLALLGGSSRVDILICTPGRLIDHLNGTPNFTLQHLRFLVIDEADRLLAQSFQDWLAQVLAAIRSPTFHKGISCDDHAGFHAHPDPVAPHMLQHLPFPHIPTFLTEVNGSSCQKLLFSATLTHDPGKIASLELREPKYFIVQKREDRDGKNRILDVVMEKFSMPSTLQEHMIVCEPSQKPLMFLHLVFGQNLSNALVFTKSAESTTRLVQLFDFFHKWQASESQDLIVVRAYSSDLPLHERKALLEQFKAQKVHILICSDLISRGIDISHVPHIISYDVPVDMRKYVHRAGRTARAGRPGCAWTLVEEQEARYFKNMLKDAGHLEQVKRLRINEKDLGPLTPGYEIALKQLKAVYTRS